MPCGGLFAAVTLQEVLHMLCLHTHLVVNLFGTVEHHTLVAQRLGQIFDSLRLASTCWPGWSPTQLELQGGCQRHVATLCDRGDDQARRAAQVLIAILKPAEATAAA